MVRNIREVALLTISVIGTFTSLAIAGCPGGCICKWKGGKQTVECINKSLTFIPDGMDSATQVLELPGNNLQSLGKEIFQRLGMINLQKIYLPRCRLSDIDSRAFKGLSNLVELDLSNNILDHVPTETFADYPSLMKFFMNNNPINIIKKDTFEKLPYLTTLELSRCEIRVIENGAFGGLSNLEYLKLDNNLIRTVSGKALFPWKLHDIALSDNPLSCDCHLLPFHNYARLSNLSSLDDVVCDTPSRLKGIQIKVVPSEEFACIPEVSPSAMYLEVAEGKNITITCNVIAIPPAKLSWIFHHDNVINQSYGEVAGNKRYEFHQNSPSTVDLFIGDVTSHDNGTFTCEAENIAGKSNGNYTLNVILKQEPLIVENRIFRIIPQNNETVVMIASAASALILLALFVGCLIRRGSKRNRSNEDKNGDRKNSSGQQSIRSPINSLSESVVREAVSTKTINNNKGRSPSEPAPSAVSLPPSNNENPDQIRPETSEPPQIDAHPDLINNASSSAASQIYGVAYSMPSQRPQLPCCYSTMRGVRPYPNDYGLPRLPTVFPPILPATAYCRTLPNKKKLSAGLRLPRDAEFAFPTFYEMTNRRLYNVNCAIPQACPFPSPRGYVSLDMATSTPINIAQEARVRNQSPAADGYSGFSQRATTGEPLVDSVSIAAANARRLSVHIAGNADGSSDPGSSIDSTHV